MSSEEKESPILVAWTTLPVVSDHRAPVHNHALHRTDAMFSGSLYGDGNSRRHTGIYDTVQVEFPFDPSQKWRQDTAIHFKLNTKTKNHDGQYTYASEAYTEFYLADLLDGDSHTSPLRVGSYYMPPKGSDNTELVNTERHKGDMEVTLMSTHTPEWEPPGRYDITPANKIKLQSALMMGISRHMAPFETMVTGSQGLQPTMPELVRIHAPIWVNETDLAPSGSQYFAKASAIAKAEVTNLPGGTNTAKDFYTVLCKQSLARHNMSESELIACGARFAGDVDADASISDAMLIKAVAVLATTCTQTYTMMRYSSDRAVLAQSKRTVPVESFDNASNRNDQTQDQDGVKSHDLVLQPTAFVTTGAPTRFGASLKKKPHVARNVASGGGIDCEDGANGAAKRFLNLVDSGSGLPDVSTHRLLKPLREIGKHFSAMAILCSVYSASLGEATGNSDASIDNAMPTIKSQRDREVVPGAHMFLLINAKTVLMKNVGKALAASAGISQARKASLDLGFDRPPKSPLQSGADLPSMVFETTGYINPDMTTAASRETTLKGKVKAAIGALSISEAHLRLVSAMTSEDVEASVDAMVSPAPEIMNKFNPMHRQDRIIEDKQHRLVDRFYRFASECFGIATAAQVKSWRQKSLISGNLPVFANHFMIPVDLSKPGTPTWGVDVSQIMRGEANVGFLPTPAPTKTEVLITDSVVRHMEPGAAFCLGHQIESDEYLTAAMDWPAMFQKYSGLESATVAQARLGKQHKSDHESVVIHTFAHPRDLSHSDIPVLARWLKDNPHVVAANIVIERATYHLGMVRLDALMDVGDLSASVTQNLTKAFVQRYPHLAPSWGKH